jgi:N-acylneuraminate cytidylyltransferase
VGVPRKNLAPVGGLPLVARAVQVALGAGFDRVVVSTDDAEIAAVAGAAGADVVRRPAALATGTASSEAAVLHALDELAVGGFAPGVVALVQATSPFVDPAGLARAVASVRAGEADVVFAATRSHAFQWRQGEAGLEAVGHSATHRPMRQERPPVYQETGAFYVMAAAGFRAAGHRFFGRLAIEEVAPETAIEIDTPFDLAAWQAPPGRARMTPAQPDCATVEPRVAKRMGWTADGSVPASRNWRVDGLAWPSSR